MPCHQNSAGMSLVSNKGYENNENPNGPSPSVNGTSVPPPAEGKSYVQFAQDGSLANKDYTEAPMEEVSLNTMGTNADESRRLCPCEEEGRTCRCSMNARPNAANAAEPWNKCKMIALGVVTALVGVWLVVYISLSQTRVV